MPRGKQDLRRPDRSDTVTVRAVAPGRTEPVRFLAVLSGPNSGEVVRVRDGMVIGRGPDAAFRPADRGVSRAHVAIALEGDQVVITDLGSSNGTYVRGDRVTVSRLRDGDQLTIGQTTFLLFTHRGELMDLRLGPGGPGVRDPATGLYTRRFFLDRLQQDLEISSLRRRSSTVSLFEVEQLARLRATHGPQATIDCVAGVARRLLASIRVEDLAARYGDHQFAIQFTGVPLPVGHRIAARCARSASAPSLVRGAPTLRLAIAVGTVAVEAGQTATQIMKAAEEALTRVRPTGRI